RGTLETLAASYAAKRALAGELGHLDLAIAANPRARAVRLEIANGYAALGQLDRAEREVRAVIAATPEDLDAHLALREIAMPRRDPALARAEAEAALAAKPDLAAGQSLLARALLADGAAEAALALAERAAP